MSLQEVQARTTELQMRLRALTTGGLPGGTLGVAGPAADAFAGQLQAATARTGAAAPALRAGSGASPVLPGSGDPTGADLVATAESEAGTPYVWGGSSPAGFDCSGLVQWTYEQHGIDLPRHSSDQAKVGRAVSPAEAQPGDLVFFDHSGRPDHIGLYAGNGEWIVAPKTGDVVKRQKVDLSQATTIRRVLPDAGTSALRGSGAVAPDWSRGLPAAGQRYAPLVQSAADKAGLDPRLLASLAWTESGFDPTARSGAGAQGLVQLMPATARGLGVTDTSDPAQSLTGGATYLKQQLDAFGGDPSLALAAYNAGPTAVRKHGGVPPYAETQKYVRTVLDRFRSLGGTP